MANLKDTLFCCDCEEVFSIVDALRDDAVRCPACASSAIAPLACWVLPLDGVIDGIDALGLRRDLEAERLEATC